MKYYSTIGLRVYGYACMLDVVTVLYMLVILYATYFDFMRYLGQINDDERR